MRSIFIEVIDDFNVCICIEYFVFGDCYVLVFIKIVLNRNKYKTSKNLHGRKSVFYIVTKKNQTNMEHTSNVPSVKSDFGNESNDNSAACLVKHSTQHSTDFSRRFDSDNKEKAGDSDQNDCTCNDEVTATVTATNTPTNKKFSSSFTTSHLTKNSIIYFDDFNHKTTILSPVSELSFNVALTKVSTCDVMGECILTGTLKCNEKNSKNDETQQKSAHRIRNYNSTVYRLAVCDLSVNTEYGFIMSVM